MIVAADSVSVPSKFDNNINLGLTEAYESVLAPYKGNN